MVSVLTAADVPREAIPKMQRRDRIPMATIVGFCCWLYGWRLAMKLRSLAEGKKNAWKGWFDAFICGSYWTLQRSAEVRLSGVIFWLVGQVHTTWEAPYLQNNRVRTDNPATGCIHDLLLQPYLLLGNEAFETILIATSWQARSQPIDSTSLPSPWLHFYFSLIDTCLSLADRSTSCFTVTLPLNIIS